MLIAALAGAACGAPHLAAASDADLRAALAGDLGGVDRTAASADPRVPASVQALYEAARDLEEGLRDAGPVGTACRPLRAAALAYVRARVGQAEGVDRLSPGRAAAGRRSAEAARRRLAAARPGCRTSARPVAPAVPAIAPSSDEAFFGAVVASAPAGATAAHLWVDGQAAGEPPIRAGRARATVSAPPGPHDLEVRFTTDGRVVATARAARVRLLDASGRAARPADRLDDRRSRRLAGLARGLDGNAAIWTQDLVTGTAAGWNADARFPAASTVKLGLLVAALARRGAGPSPLRYDLQAMARWSSNLATNRLLERLGGSEGAGARLAQDALRRMGAAASTFPGGYIVGTELQPAIPGVGAPDPPPVVSTRVTTARDLARVLFAVHAAAAGNPTARRTTGLSTRAARLALGWLLSSEQGGDNVSLVAGGLPAGTPVAQKNGWLRAARHGAAIAYEPTGPRIHVVMTYRASGIARARAAALGSAVASLDRRPG